jgi:Glycosyl hydrolases family 43
VWVVLVLLLLVVSCDDSSTDGVATSQCEANAPAQLASKVDDDDGDGKPLDEDFPVIDDEDDDIADHAWIEDRFGIYHLFFHSENLYHPNQIEHYTTRDFQHLDYVGVALTVNPGAWDTDALWAPHVVEDDGTYFMFYTGVTGSGVDAIQRIGLATSTDLVMWTRFPANRCPGTNGDGCIYECDEPWTTWGDAGGSYDHQCRDPFVMWDAGAQRWLMFATAKSTNQFGVVTVARASDLSAWAGEGFIDATRRLATGTGAQTTGGQAENPFVVTSAGLNFLLFTDWEDPQDSVSVANPRTIAQYATSPSLSLDASGSADWTYRGYLPDTGVNAIEVIELRRQSRWFMSQSISSPMAGYPRTQRRTLLIRCATWGADGSVRTSNWGPTGASGLRQMSDLVSP